MGTYMYTADLAIVCENTSISFRKFRVLYQSVVYLLPWLKLVAQYPTKYFVMI